MSINIGQHYRETIGHDNNTRQKAFGLSVEGTVGSSRNCGEM